MKWVTRSQVHMDRMACLWLITRFVHSAAEFLFVPQSRIPRVVEGSGAIPFDAPGVELGHRDGKCSLETILVQSDLTGKALLRLARIVHRADVEADREAELVATGLEAIAVGYSQRFPDDLENPERQFDVYDALYAWCRLQMAKE